MLDYIKDFFGSYMLMSAGASWLGAQIIKVFTGMFKDRDFDIVTLLFSTGGMPSSHSAVVCGLATASIIKYGIGSPYAAISIVLCIIVMIDASGVRYETGKQAKIINKITKELFSGNQDEINTGLKELVGHTPFQVIMGALFGIAVAVLLGFFMI